LPHRRPPRSVQKFVAKQIAKAYPLTLDSEDMGPALDELRPAALAIDEGKAPPRSRKGGSK
jgi:hypothetical protein